MDIFTGHEGKRLSAFYSEDYFSLHIYRKTMHFLKTCRGNYESTACDLTKFCENINF